MSASAEAADPTLGRVCEQIPPSTLRELPIAVPADARVANEPSPELPCRAPALRLLPMPRRAESFATRLAWTGIAICIATLYLFVLLTYWSPAHPGVDQNGYLVGGRSFAATGSTGLPQTSNYDFVGRMYVTAPSGINYPKYPLGLPILFAICIWLAPITGWNGYEVAHLISPTSTALAVLGVFGITRRLAGGFAGVLALLLMASGQVMLTLSINPNSHAAGTCTVVWGIYFLIRFLETGTLWRGLAAGFLLGFAYLIRYTDGLLLLPLGVAMLYMARWHLPRARTAGIVGGVAVVFASATLLVAYFWGATLAGRYPSLTPLSTDNGRALILITVAVFAATIASLFVQPRAWWRLLVVGLAWLIPVAYQTIFNMVAMQSFTSYANTNESTGFTADDFSRNWELMIRTLHDQALFFIAPLGVLGLLVMARRMPMIALMLALWFVPSVLLYTAYYWAPDTRGVSYSRFILTQIPALVIAAAGLLGEVVRQQGKMAWRVGRRGTIVIAWMTLVLGIAAIAYGSWRFDSTRDGPWWAIVGPGVALAIAGATLLLGRFINRDDVTVTRHFNGTLVRLAVGAVVFIASGVGLYRTTIGSEWGTQMNARASIEVQARQNANLAALGRAVRATVPDGSVLFADGDRMHHFQFIGGWQMFFTDYFNHERVQRSLLGRSAETEDPHPIDPSRIRFLKTVYDKKDQAALRADMNNLIGDALTGGRRVFYVLTTAGGESFRRTLDRKRFETKPVAAQHDVPPPRWETEFLPPTQRPRLVNRFGGARGGNLGSALAAGERQVWRIVEVVPVKPTTKPTTAPAP
jgi:4-amino-4-deoxy-L-arabinose transferase-like glycosyltransferase